MQASGRNFISLPNPPLAKDHPLAEDHQMSLSPEYDDNFKTRYPDHKEKDVDAIMAVRFLKEIAAHGPVTIVTIAVGGAVRHRVFDTSDPAALDDLRSFIAFHETVPAQVFYLANQAYAGCKTVPSTEDIEWIRLIVLDFDPDKDRPLDEERERLRRIAHDLISGPLQPRAVIDTGGGMQVVYQLLEPIRADPQSIIEIELLMKSLARSLGADTATCTAKNLFRVPCTWNWPTPAKQKAGRAKSVSGLWHLGGPKCSLADLRALVTVNLRDEGPSIPVEFGDLAESDVIAVLGDPEALPGRLIERLREDPALLAAVQRPPPPNDRSKGDFNLCCTLSRARFEPCDMALMLSAFGHKVHETFQAERLFSYVTLTVQKALDKTRPDLLFTDFAHAEETEGARERQHKRQARLAPITMEVAMQSLFEVDQNSLIEGFMQRNEVTVLYGRPGSGKTFVALDLAFHIAHGLEWNGRKVKQAAVIYIALESPWGIRYRFKAMGDRFGAPDQLFLIPASVNLFDPRIDMKILIEEIAKIEVDVGLIVIDTLARAMIGGNENSTQDMNQLIANGDTLRDRFNANIMWVHHSGKNEALGARGSSALLAATDTELEVINYCLRSTKMRDRDDVDYRFRLQQVVTGTMPNGEVMTSCVVNWFKDIGPLGQNTPETNNLKIIVEILRMRAAPLTFKEILAEAELVGRKFTVKQDALRRALERACADETQRIFTREMSQVKSGANTQYVYGLVNW
jgi:hypothetical protein